jgi:actin-related protein
MGCCNSTTAQAPESLKARTRDATDIIQTPPKALKVHVGDATDSLPTASSSAGGSELALSEASSNTPSNLDVEGGPLVLDDVALVEAKFAGPSPLELRVPLVADIGGSLCKAGLADQDDPSVVFPSVVGLPKTGQHMDEQVERVGHEALSRRAVLDFKFPIEKGVVTNWDVMEKVWRHTFCNELHVDLEQHPVLLTEPPLNPKANRERMTQMMFETFRVPALHIAQASVLSLYGSARTTGMVVDCGDGVTHAVPIYEGYVMAHAILRLNLAGRKLTEFMMEMLNAERGYSFTTADREAVRDLKEQFVYVSLDFNADVLEPAESLDEEFELPDGTLALVGSERFRCAEALFQPDLAGVEGDGIHKVTFASIMKCDVDLREQLFSNVVLAGGTSGIPGMDRRLEQELRGLTRFTVRVEAPQRKHLAWFGGSAWAMAPIWVSRAEYNERGPAIVHAKCF